MGMQALLQVIYPSQCMTCDASVATDFGLCAECWRNTPFVGGLTCTKCGSPLPGEDDTNAVLCDDCLTIARPWDRGRAALLYQDNARNLVLALKHGDRIDLAVPVAGWMVHAARDILEPGLLVAPVPLHWLRLFKRRYNQAALLSGNIARLAELDHCPDLLQRRRNTGSQDGLTRDGRFANMADSLSVHPRREKLIPGRHVLIVDDVMTSGATLAAATEVCLAKGASKVSVLVMARVLRGD